MKILLAIDGSESCSKAVNKVAELGENLDIKLTIITVIEEGNISVKITDTKEKIEERFTREDDLKSEADNIVKSCENQLFKNMKSISNIIRKGNPAEMICREANEGDYDLIVVSDLGRGALKKFLLGSTTEKVVRHCSKSVLVVK